MTNSPANSEASVPLPPSVDESAALSAAKSSLDRLLVLLVGLVVLNGLILVGLIWATTPSVFVPRLARRAELELQQADAHDAIVAQGREFLRDMIQKEVDRTIERLPAARQQVQDELIARAREIVAEEKTKLMKEPYYLQSLARRASTLVDQGYAPEAAAELINQDLGELEYPAQVLVYSLSGAMLRVERQLELLDRGENLNRRQASFRKTLQALQTLRNSARGSTAENGMGLQGSR